MILQWIWLLLQVALLRSTDLQVKLSMHTYKEYILQMYIIVCYQHI